MKTKLKKMENSLAEKYMPDVFRGTLEGQIINMEHEDIVNDAPYQKASILKQQQFQAAGVAAVATSYCNIKTLMLLYIRHSSLWQ